MKCLGILFRPSKSARKSLIKVQGSAFGAVGLWVQDFGNFQGLGLTMIRLVETVRN